MNLKQLFGKKVREYRDLKGITQENLCEKINITPQTLSGIENGHTFPSYKVLTGIISALEIKPELLFTYDKRNDIAEFQVLITEYKKLNNKQKQNVFDIIKNINEATK